MPPVCSWVPSVQTRALLVSRQSVCHDQSCVGRLPVRSTDDRERQRERKRTLIHNYTASWSHKRGGLVGVEREERG